MEVSSQLEALVAFPRGRALNTFGQEAGWAPEPIWTLWRRENWLLLPGIETQFVGRPVHLLANVLTEISFFVCVCVFLNLQKARSDICFLRLMKERNSVDVMRFLVLSHSW